MRWVFVAVGLAAIAASTAMAINAAGGLSALTAFGIIAMGLVLAVGAGAIGYAVRNGYLGLAVMIGLGMVSGELGAMVQTAQRVTAAREAQRAPFVAVGEQRKAALAALAAAEAAKPESISRKRLDAAIAAKAAAERTVAEKAADRGCRENCRVLLQAAVDAAGREVEAARADLVKVERGQADEIATRLASAKAAVAALPPPQSTTPLADYTGIPEWLLDLVEALALSFAINLPASALVALGVKGNAVPTASALVAETKTEVAADAVTNMPADRPKALLAPQRRSPKAEADRFGGAMLLPDPSASISSADLYSAYVKWCRSRELDPLPVKEIAPALSAMFRGVGLTIENDGAVRGLAVKC